jgi:hypothetical protein
VSKVSDADVEAALNGWNDRGPLKADEFYPDALRGQMKRALAAASSLNPVEPVAWKLVPVEPTDEMASAAINLDPKSDLDAKYRAMLGAAPPPEHFGFVPLSVYESAVKGRQDFRQAFRDARGLTCAQVVEMLRERFDASGLSFDAYGESVGLSGEFIRCVLNGTRPPSRGILGLLGLEIAKVFRKAAS